MQNKTTSLIKIISPDFLLLVNTKVEYKPNIINSLFYKCSLFNIIFKTKIQMNAFNKMENDKDPKWSFKYTILL